MDKNSKIAIGASIAGGLLLLVVFGSRRKSGGGAHVLPVEPAVDHAVQQAAAFQPVRQAGIRPPKPAQIAWADLLLAPAVWLHDVVSIGLDPVVQDRSNPNRSAWVATWLREQGTDGAHVETVAHLTALLDQYGWENAFTDPTEARRVIAAASPLPPIRA